MTKMTWGHGIIALMIVGCGDSKNETVADCSPGEAEIHAEQTYCIYRGAIIETRFDCPEFAPFQHELEDMTVCSPGESLPPNPGWETTEPIVENPDPEENNDVCQNSSASFGVFENLCELVDVSCGGGQMLTHQSTSTAQVGDKVITTHVFLDGDNASVELFEECGEACGVDVAGGCALEGMIQGEAFVIYDADENSDYPKYLAGAFRTDIVDGGVSDIFGRPTKFVDLADVQARWATTSAPFAQGCSVPEGWCAEDFMIYE